MANNNNATNVSAGKPKVGGAVFVAPTGTALPTTALAELNDAFKPLGFVSDEGVTNANSPTSENIKAWGGDVVLAPVNERPDTFKLTLIEAMNIEVLKFVYGASNVTGDLESGITIEANSSERLPVSMVIDMHLNGGVSKRVVIPLATIFELSEIVYNDSSAIGYGATVNAAPDPSSAKGNTHYEYIQKAATSGTAL